VQQAKGAEVVVPDDLVSLFRGLVSESPSHPRGFNASTPDNKLAKSAANFCLKT
jgi:hypothetical protein